MSTSLVVTAGCAQVARDAKTPAALTVCGLPATLHCSTCSLHLCAVHGKQFGHLTHDATACTRYGCPPEGHRVS